MYCEGEESTGPQEEGHTSSLHSAEDDDSGGPHSYPAYLPRFNLANRPKSRLGRRHVRMAPVKLEDEGEASDSVCSEQKSGSTPFPTRSSGMAWLRETPIKSIYPTTPGLSTRENMENAKSGYKSSFSFQRCDKTNTDVDPLSFHSALFSNTAEKSVHSIFNPTLGLKNIIFKNTPFKGSENNGNILNSINQQGKSDGQGQRDGTLRIKLFESTNDDKENISDNLKPMDRKLMEINSNTQGLFSDLKPLSFSSDILLSKGSAENEMEANTDTPLDLSSAHSHSGHSSILLEMNSVDGFNKIVRATDNNNDMLKTDNVKDKIISNLPSGVENKPCHSSHPAVLFRKPFDPVINKNYVLIPGSEKLTSHNQQDYDQKHLPTADTRGVTKEQHKSDNNRIVNFVTEMKTEQRNSEQFSSSDDSSNTSGPTAIKVSTANIPVVLAQGQSVDLPCWAPDSNQHLLSQQQNVLSQQNKVVPDQSHVFNQQNVSQNRASNQLPTVFSHNSITNQNITAPHLLLLSKNTGQEALVAQQTSNNNASSKLIPACSYKGPFVLNKSNQFKTHDSYANALKQVASKIVLPSQKQSKSVLIKGDSVLPRPIHEGKHWSEIDHPNIKEVQQLDSLKTLNENFLNKNFNPIQSVTHSQESHSSTASHEPLLKNEMPAATDTVNIKNQTNLDYQHPNYVLVGECKPQYLNKQEKVICHQSIHSQQLSPETPSLENEALTLPVCELVNSMKQIEFNSLQQCKQVSSPVAEQESVQEIEQGSSESPSQQPHTTESQMPSPEYYKSESSNMPQSCDNMVFAKPGMPPPQKLRNVLPTVKLRQPMPKAQIPNTTTNVQNNFKYVMPRNTQPQQNKILSVNGKAYTVLSILGRGGSSEVYQVLDTKTSKLMAVKCVDLSIVDPVIAEGYLNEIELLSKLQGCESVIRMFDHEYIKETMMVYVVMEKGDTDLSKLIRDISKTKKIPMSMVIHYWTEMLTAVKDIHDRGIIHSDLKPANFLLVSGRLKLIDFGIASSLQGDMTSVHKEMTTGTWNYMSPEAFHNSGGIGRGIKITYKSDVWSLGCILYNLIYGKTPFSHITRTWDKLQAIVDPSHKIDFSDVGVPVVLDRALKLCFHRDPKQRPSVAQLLDMPYHTNVDPEYLSKQLQSILPPEYWKAVAHLFSEQKTQQEEPSTEDKKSI